MTEREQKALGALRRLNDRFGGFGPGQWTFDGQHIPDGPVVDALLALADNLNDVDGGIEVAGRLT